MIIVNNTLYIKSTDELRPFLELAGYGCYSRQQMKQRMEKAGTYDKRIEFLNVCLSPTYWHYSRQGKERRFSFHGDAYHRLHNYLTPIFAMKSLDIQWLLCYLMILAVLNRPEAQQTGITYSDLQDTVIQALYDLLLPHLQQVPFRNQADWKKQLKKSKLDHKDTLFLALQLYHESWASQIRRRAKELADAGLIISQRDGKELRYRLIPAAPVLTAPETRRFAQVLSFYEGAALLRLPGCYLSQRYPEYQLPYYQVQHHRLLSISNDPQVYLLLQALRSSQAVSFSYRGTPKEGYPMKVWIDAYQREYVRLREANQCATYRIHRMSRLRLEKQAVKAVRKEKKTQQQILLRIHYQDIADFRESVAKIQDHFPKTEAEAESMHTALCQIGVQDGRSLIPWLRTLHPAVEVVTDSTGKLRDRLQKDFEEALAQYE